MAKSETDSPFLFYISSLETVLLPNDYLACQWNYDMKFSIAFGIEFEIIFTTRSMLRSSSYDTACRSRTQRSQR